MNREILLHVLFFLFAFAAANAETISWIGGDTDDATDWFKPANWDLERVPAAGDDVKISAPDKAIWTVVLSASTPHLKSIELVHANPEISAKSHLYFKFQNWTTCLTADDIYIRKGAMVCTVGSFSDTVMSNRVWIVGNNLMIDKNDGSWTTENYYNTPIQLKDGTIFVTALGYQAGKGPAWSGVTYNASLGGIHGGGLDYLAANWTKATSGPLVYGDPEWPYEPGSGGGYLQAEGGLGNGQNGSWGGGGGRIAVYATTFETNGTFSVSVADGSSLQGSTARADGPGGDGTLRWRRPAGLTVILC